VRVYAVLVAIGSERKYGKYLFQVVGSPMRSKTASGRVFGHLLRFVREYE